MSEAALEYLEKWAPSAVVGKSIEDFYHLPTGEQVSNAIRKPKVLPLDYMVLVMVPPLRRTTESGLVVASNSEAKTQESGAPVGIVVAIGENAWKTTASGVDMTIRPQLRDIVLYPRFSGTIPMIPGLAPGEDAEGSVRLVKDEEIIAVVGRVS